MSRRNIAFLISVAALGILAVAGLGITLGAGSDLAPVPSESDDPNHLHGLVLVEPEQAPDFSLHDQDGQPFNLKSTNGKIVLILFGYTDCPDVCPTGVLNFEWLGRELGLKADNVEFLFMTVDPEKDTSDRLKGYLSERGERVTGLTGTFEELEPVWHSYGVDRRVFLERNLTAIPEQVVHEHVEHEHTLSHTSYIVLIDRSSNVRALYPYGIEAQDMLKDIKVLLAEPI